MNTAIKQSMGPREWVMLAGLSMLWGASFFFIAIALEGLPPLTIVTLRVGLAALVLWAVVVALGLERPRSAGVWAAFAVMGLTGNALPFTLIVWGQTHIAAGLASILNATTPLFGVVVAGLMLADERMTAARVTGVLVGFAGVVVMIGSAALYGLGAHVLAQLAVLGASFSYACAGVYGRRFRPMGIDPITAAAGQVTGAWVLLAPVALYVERPLSLPVPGPAPWAAVLALALLSTVLAYILYFRLLAVAGVTNLLLVAFLIPVTALLLGVLVLGETLGPSELAGMALIGLGLSVIDGRLWRRLREASSASRIGHNGS